MMVTFKHVHVSLCRLLFLLLLVSIKKSRQPLKVLTFSTALTSRKMRRKKRTSNNKKTKKRRRKRMVLMMMIMMMMGNMKRTKI